MQLKDVIVWKSESGNPLTVHGMTVTPQSRVLRVQLPFGGFVWNRPSAVLVQHNGRQEHIPIIDITRSVTISLLGATVLLWLLIARLTGEKQRDNSTQIHPAPEEKDNADAV